MTFFSPRRTRSCVLSLCLGFAAACGSSDAVVTIDGKSVSKEEFAAYLKYKRLESSDAKRLERVLDEYSERSAMAAAIEREGVLSEAEINAELGELKKEMLISRYFDKLLNERVGDDAVRNYYNEHAKDYEERKVHVAHILVRADSTMDEATRTAKATRAQEAYSKIRAGEPFAQVADGYSEDRISGPKGGDIGWLKQGAVDPKFSDVVFKLKPGEVSEPFLTQFGYHVVTVLEGPTNVKRPFEMVSGDIRYQLRQEAKDAELKRLTGKVKVQKNLSLLKTLAAPRQPGASGQKRADNK